MKKYLTIHILLVMPFIGISQGYNHQWLIGNTWLFSVPKARIYFDSSSYIFQTEFRKMGFAGTDATICDVNGNFLMSSNGVWIADATNDTMMNGSGLNPGPEVLAYPQGLYLPYSNILLNFPDDTTKYYLVHQTGTGNNNYPSSELFYSIIDLSANGGLGAVIQKNVILFQDTIGWGIAACRHANGRDWWVVAMKDSLDLIYKVLLTTNGISSVSTQKLNFNPYPKANAVQMCFSPDGNKFISTTYDNPVSRNSSVVTANFDRCTGMFSNVQTTLIASHDYLWGLALSPSGQYAYACTDYGVYQINMDSLTFTLVATYDGFISGLPPTCCATTFWNFYLAANGKIYITSGSSVQHIHEMNYPDSAGLACDVQQHVINLGVWNFRSVPNHPNYYLGPVVGSVCDSLTGIDDHLAEIQHFSIRPNPNNGDFSISYLLPQNKPGLFEVFDVNGRKVYKMPLPQWSTLQQIKLPKLAEGIYNAVITSGGYRVSKKIAIINESYK